MNETPEQADNRRARAWLDRGRNAGPRSQAEFHSGAEYGEAHATQQAEGQHAALVEAARAESATHQENASMMGSTCECPLCVAVATLEESKP